MEIASRIVPPRWAETTIRPARAGPSSTCDHSSALNSAFWVIGLSSRRVGGRHGPAVRLKTRRCRARAQGRAQRQDARARRGTILGGADHYQALGWQIARWEPIRSPANRQEDEMI